VKIPFLLFAPEEGEKAGKRFKGLGKLLAKIKPGLEKDLRTIDLGVEEETYALTSLLSATVYGLLFVLLTIVILWLRGTYEEEVLYRTISIVGITFISLFFILHMIYPSMIAKKIAAAENKDLLFALRELTMMVESGVILFDAMKSIGYGGYSYVSNDFARVVRKIEAGMPEREALKELALTSKNEYTKRACWQLVNALESGAPIENALRSLTEALENQLYNDIRNYSSSMNFLMLLYMLVAAAIPSLGLTFFILLSTFSGVGVTIETIWTLIVISVLAQLAIIGYMIKTRPEIVGS
jgi:flagellar protein FlaJ